MAARRDPREGQREREQLRQEIEATEPEDISLGMVPLAPGDVDGIFTMLKAFRSKFPAHAEGLIERVGKMLKATQEEMEAGLKTRARNDWKPKMGATKKGSMLANAREVLENQPPDVGRALGRSLPEAYVPARGGRIGHAVPVPPQGPNAERAAKAITTATEKVITCVESAIRNAPKK